MAEVKGAKHKHVVKMVQVDLTKGVNEAQVVLEEAKNLIKLSHPNVVEYKDVFLHRSMTDKSNVFAEPVCVE
jgi:serine/threonine protein kinase